MSATVYVEIDEFSDEEILEAAASIIERLTKEPKRDNPAYAVEYEHIDAIAQKVGQSISERELPPASTAARIHSMEMLRNYLGRKNQ